MRKKINGDKVKRSIKVFFVLLLTVTLIYPKEFNVDKSETNEVKFISDTSLESFEGVTDNIDGYLYWEEDDLTKNSQLYFEVDLNTLDTGIGLRNRHMRENYLETEKYQFTNFSGKIVKVEKKENRLFEVEADGTLSIHGVVQPLMLKANIEMSSDRSYKIKSSFTVKLSDFNIEVPSLMFLKLSELIVVELNFNITEKNNAG